LKKFEWALQTFEGLLGLKSSFAKPNDGCKVKLAEYSKLQASMRSWRKAYEPEGAPSMDIMAFIQKMNNLIYVDSYTDEKGTKRLNPYKTPLSRDYMRAAVLYQVCLSLLSRDGVVSILLNISLSMVLNCLYHNVSIGYVSKYVFHVVSLGNGAFLPSPQGIDHLNTCSLPSLLGMGHSIACTYNSNTYDGVSITSRWQFVDVEARCRSFVRMLKISSFLVVQKIGKAAFRKACGWF
jgi:hypothetical protein